MKDTTFVAGGLAVAALVAYGALHPPARTVAAPDPAAVTANAAPAAAPSRSSSDGASREATPSMDQHLLETTLAGLTITPRVHRGDYDRDAFGTSWKDTDHNGCNQRDDVLLRDAVAGTTRTAQQGSCDHDVLAGTWIDPYTGRRIVLTDAKAPSQSQEVQIDHVVPLSEAWSSGAWTWSGERREEFANDLGVLLAVDGPTNASKGDDDPAAWRPRKGYQCAYAKRWITVKARWQLEVDSSEVNALREMLGYC